MKKVKKGSTLVMVIIIFSILSILGIAISSLAVSSYKVRAVKANVNKNLYASEAGLEEAYAIIGNAVDVAIEEGNKAVNDFMAELNITDFLGFKTEDSIDEERISVEQNTRFRKAFVKALLGDEWDIDPITKKTPDAAVKVIESVNDASLEFKYNNVTSPDVTAKLSEIASIVDYTSDTEIVNPLLTITITSNFKLNELEKVLMADYDIHVPSYKGTYYLETIPKEVPQSVVWTKGLAAGGDININTGANIDGEVFSGNDININAEGAAVRFLGDSNIAAAGDFIVSSKAEVTIGEGAEDLDKIASLLADNVKIQETGAEASLIVKGSVYTRDDLEINGKNSSVTINNGYFGLSDGSLTGAKTHDKSSSININAIDDEGKVASNLTIRGKSYIMGTSYIDVLNSLGENYQTGESISIKGNYKAYTYPLNNSDKYKAAEFEDYSFSSNSELSLGLVSRYNSIPMNVFDKGEYFKLYNEEYLASYGLNWDKIDIIYGEESIPNFIHIGAIIANDGNVMENNYLVDYEEELKVKQREFARIVYNMGEPLKTKKVTIDGKEVEVIDEEKVPKSLEKSVESQFLTGSIKNDMELLEHGDKGVIAIRKGNYTLTNTNLDSKIEGDAIKINKSNSKGVIIVDGDINISGAFDFEGTIIATGNINIIGSEPKNIKYNEGIVKYLIEAEWEIFNSINNSGLESETVYESKMDSASNIKSTVKKDKIIKLKNWTIVK